MSKKSMKSKFMKKQVFVFLILFIIQFAESNYSQFYQKPKLVVQLGHSGEVKSAVFSPDGQLIASNGAGGIIIWQSSTGREIRRIAGVFSAIDFAPDSKSVVAGEAIEESVDGEEEERKTPFSIEIFDVSNGKLIKKFPSHKNTINSIKFSNDGKLILTASDDHTAKLWGIEDGSLKKSFVGHKSEVSCAVFSPNNKFIATSGVGEYSSDEHKFIGDSSAIIWDVTSGKIIKKLIHIDEGKSTFRGIGFIHFSPDNELLLTSAKDSVFVTDEIFSIRVWKWKTGEKKYSFDGTGPAIFSPDGKYVLADIVNTSKNSEQENDKGLIELINIQNGKAIPRFDDIDWFGQIESFSFSPDGKNVLIAVGLIDSGGSGVGKFGDETLRMYDTESGKEVYNLGGNLQQIKQLSISKNENIVLAGDYVWNLEKGELVNLEGFKPENLEREFNYRFPRRILSSDGGLVAESLDPFTEENSESINESGIQIWNTKTGQKTKLLPAEQWKSAEFISNNQFILAETASDVCLWSVVNAKEIWCHDHTASLRATYAMSNIKDGIRFSVISDDEKIVYISKNENTLIAVEAVTGELIWQKSIEMGEKPGIFLSDKYIIVNSEGYGNNFLIFLDLKTRNEILKVETEDNILDGSNSFSTNNKTLLLILQKSTKKRALIDKNTGKIIATLPKDLSDYELTYYEVYGSRLGLSSDAKKFLAIVGEEIRLYDLASGKVLKIFKGHNSGISRAMFFNDDNYVISSSLDGTTRIWDVKTGKELCSLISFDNGTWFVTAPDGRFDTNNIESSTAGIHWIVPDEPLNPLPIEIFMRQYYEPKLLPRLLKCTEENSCDKEFKPLPSIADINRVQPKVAIKGIKPNAVSSDLADVTIEVENITEDVSLSATDRTKKKQLSSGAFDLRLFRDGQLVGDSTPKDKLEKFISDAPRLVAETKTSGKLVNTPEDAAWREANDVFTIKSENVKIISPTKIEYTFRNVKIPKDGRKEVEFSAYAFNWDKVKSTTTEPFKFEVPKTIAATKKKGRAFLVSIGVNASENPVYDLRYAANDARKMQEIVGARLKADVGSKYSEVVQIPLVSDAAAGKESSDARKDIIKGVFSLLAARGNEVSPEVLKQIEKIARIPAVEPEDTLIISFSGHGYADRNGIFYLLPADIPKNATIATSEFLQRTISSDELSLWMRDITAQEMIMIVDACHSAAAVQGNDFKPGPMGSRGLGQLAYDKGMKILAATQTDNVALELAKLQQGLLSYVLLKDGIEDKKADTEPAFKQLTATEWLNFAVKEVPQLYEDIRAGKRGVIIDGKEFAAGQKGIEIVTDGRTKKSGVNLQQPALFDFRRKKTNEAIFDLP